METSENPAASTSFALLERYRRGDESAAEALFARYFGRLTLLARSRLAARLSRRTDPEDVVLSVYRSFFLDARAGRLAWQRGGDLWRLLAAITRRKALRQARFHRAGRRSVDRESPPGPADAGFAFVQGREPTPADAAALADELERVASRLDPFGRRVLELRLQGASLLEIADDTGRSERTARRTLAQIRTLLDGRLGDA